MNHEALDLSGDTDLTVALLKDGYWRSRVVETITIDRAHAMRAHRSVQTAPIAEIVADVLEADTVGDLPDLVHVGLPIGMLPKRTMVAFDIRSDEGTAYLLKRKETARRQAEYLCALAVEAGKEPTVRLRDFWQAMCEFTPGPWQSYRLRWGRLKSEKVRIHQYLKDGLDMPVSDAELDHWRKDALKIRAVMLDCLKEEPYSDSSSENVLLLFPLLASANKITSPDVLTAYLREVREFVKDFEGATPPVLQVMAEYGRRYDALIMCTVPVLRPTTIEMEQDFPLKVGLMGRCSVEVPFADAASNHVAVRVTDPDCELRAMRPQGADKRPLKNQIFNLVRSSKEDFALYGSEEDRERRLRVRFRLRLPWISKLTISSFLILTLIALYLLVHLEARSSDDLAVFVVPTTLAAGIVLGQQRTSLGMRLQRTLRVLTVTAITVLWIVVAVGYLHGWITGGRP